ncbi:hypothetical protein GLYMA_19G194900v4 [Glycine max]|nr:hypothetical protein GLYMA_19G194900v4 [Glycine max]KAG4396477.1 hypothetical protein GLYMA_19G194900v4 [Glycine max]
MAHQSSSSESDDRQIPSHHQPLDLNSPHPSKDIIFNNNMELQQEESNLNKHEYDEDIRDKDKDVVTTQNPSAASETTLLCCNEENMALQEEETSDVAAAKEEEEEEDSGRERLNRHRVEVAGRVWIPDIWGQEELLKDWIDCTAFDATLVPSRISTAREALVQECTRANSAGLRIENSVVSGKRQLRIIRIKRCIVFCEN